MMKPAIVTLMLVASPLAAQDLVFSPAQTQACLRSGGGEGCIGRSAEACIENTPGGYSTVAMGGCLSMELDYWDDLLNATYRRALARARKSDVDNAGFGPSQQEALRQMQRAWIPFRDATCDFERSQWGGGTGQGPAGAECLMRVTAEQTFYLDRYAPEG
jgi:uncharacterized protein YecT (DUF1311 family)